MIFSNCRKYSIYIIVVLSVTILLIQGIGRANTASAVVIGTIQDPVNRIHTKTGTGHDMVILTGVAIVNQPGLPSSANWFIDRLQIENVGPTWNTAQPIVALSMVSLNGVNKGEQGNIAGWSVDRIHPVDFTNNKARLNADIAVRSNDATLLRVGFQAIIIGTCATPNCE